MIDGDVDRVQELRVGLIARAAVRHDGVAGWASFDADLAAFQKLRKPSGCTCGVRAWCEYGGRLDHGPVERPVNPHADDAAIRAPGACFSEGVAYRWLCTRQALARYRKRP